MSFNHAPIAQEAKNYINFCQDKTALDAARVKYLGRKGIVAELFSGIPALPQEERKAYGASLNILKQAIEEVLHQKEAALSASVASAGAPGPDITLPGKKPLLGRQHPLTQVETEICDIFGRFGFKVFEGPEVETEYNNFEALNIPLEHPSRDAFDTFYIKTEGKEESSAGRRLLRSHTSPAQIRALKTCLPPMAVVVPGRVYRPDAMDASHSFMFHQVEGIAVSEKMRFSDLKGVLIAFAREMFGEKTKLRFRPSFFPFTEPSAEVDITCFLCAGQGCPVCKKSGWLEILGCGMVHPRVLKSSGCDPKAWRGFAFGMGVERIAMLKFGITDIRMFFENDIRFLEQF
ncbi:MAG: phenylalanine--tRNA ligase subunit alpha [Candidatus Omnitrophota bacterium]